MVALVTLGCFCTLAAFSNGKYHPDAKSRRSDLMAFVDEKLEGYAPPAGEVRLWKAPATRLERVVAQANGHGVLDWVALSAERKHRECGEDFACILAWAGEGR